MNHFTTGGGLFVLTTALSLAACGGGGSGGVSAISEPAPVRAAQPVKEPNIYISVSDATITVSEDRIAIASNRFNGTIPRAQRDFQFFDTEYRRYIGPRRVGLVADLDHASFGIWADGDIVLGETEAAFADAWVEGRESASVPATGEAVYNGPAIAHHTGVGVMGGSSTVRADFTASTMTGSLDFPETDEHGGIIVTMSGTISDGRFSGMAVGSFDLLGRHEGIFFGEDAAEVGGIVDLKSPGGDDMVAAFGGRR